MTKNIMILVLLLMVIKLTGCGKDSKDTDLVKTAKASELWVNTIGAPDGSTCYVIMDGERAVGGNCK